MNKIKVSLDGCEFWSKPTTEDVKGISIRIANRIKEVDLTKEEMKKLALRIGRDGCTFCPATFKNGRRSKDTFEQQQLFTLDFDNKDPTMQISVNEVKIRAAQYELPIQFIYDTFSSVNHNKFRVVFLNDISINHRKVAEAMQLALGTIFPEADSSCYRDLSRLYFGGKELLYFNDELPTINIESVFRNLTQYLKNKYKVNHYKEKLLRFSQETSVALNDNGFLDVSVTDNPTEKLGAIQIYKNGKNSPSLIIYSSMNIKGNGEIFPYDYYCIKLNECTNKSSVTPSVTKTDGVDKKYKNHKLYRSKELPSLMKCRLFSEFTHGKRDMGHMELYGLATNLLQIETGVKLFKEIQLKYPDYYDVERREKWINNLKSFEDSQYQPTQCSKFCPYHESCKHNANILTTIRPKPGTVEWVDGFEEIFYPLEEVQEDAYDAIDRALLAHDCLVHIIKAMTAVGKTTSYLRLMSEYPHMRFLIAAPTNLLKDEIHEKAKKMGLNVRKTPSLEQIKDEIPQNVWKRIQRFYASGQYGLVHPYIYEILKKEDIPCLLEYMKEREEIKGFDGSIITTHRYLLNMDEKRLQEYDAIIIDEDILFKSVISNQGEVTLSALEKLLKESLDRRVREKIKRLLKLDKTQTCIELDSFEWENDNEDNRKIPFDIPSFCLAERFYIRRKSKKKKDLKEDTVAFLKPANFFENVKYIVVSATANEDVYRKYFGEDRVDFYKCKKARYEGVLEQYPGKSMSRTSISGTPGIIERLMGRFEISDKNKVITFLKFKKEGLHFGNTEGSNTLEGQDILVIGTPYHADFLYKLVAFTMGLDFDEDEEMEHDFIEYSGKRFWFTTFTNENLRSIQFWMIESELEQAVGRARLLRNSCKVYLFSSFILSQANIVNRFNYGKE